MSRINGLFAAGAGALALSCLAFLHPAYAHDGHVKAAGATFDPNAPKRVSAATAAAIDLQTAEVDFGRVEQIVSLTGVVAAKPNSVAAIASAFRGVVRSVHAQPGDAVRKGDTLVELDAPEVSKSVYELQRLEVDVERLLAEAARAELQAAAAEIEGPAATQGAEIVEAEVERLRSAGESVGANVLSQRRADALKLRTQAQLGNLAIGRARAEVESLRRQAASTKSAAEALAGTLPVERADASGTASPRPGLLRFVAPMDGVVVSRAAVTGQGVAEGETLLRLGNFSSVQIEGEVPEALLAQVVAAGKAIVRVKAGPGEGMVAQGVVRYISPTIDLTRRTAQVIVDVDNASGALRPGQFVDLALIAGEREAAVVVPSSAIVKEGPLLFVFIKEGKEGQETFTKRDVDLGVRDDQRVEVKQGLVPGDVIATKGAFALSQLQGFVSAQAAAAPVAPSPEAGAPGHKH